MRVARIAGANLAGADLSEADLISADLGRTNLTGADLTKANLIRASLVGATLTDTQMHGAVLTRTHIEDTDLTGAIGLTQAQLRLACGNANTKLPPGPVGQTVSRRRTLAPSNLRSLYSVTSHGNVTWRLVGMTGGFL